MRSVIAAAAVIVAAAAAQPSAVWEKDGVKIEASVASQVYTYELTNGTDSPITGLDVGSYHTYDFQGPANWTLELNEEDWTLHAAGWRQDAIRPGQRATFSVRVGSNTAAMGTAPARVSFGDGRGSIEFDAVWAPIAHPPAILALIAVTLVAITAFHALLVMRATRARARAAG